MTSHRSHFLSWSRWLFVVGALLLGSAIVLGVSGCRAARASQREFQLSLAAVARAAALPAPQVPRQGDLLGLLTIPRWDLVVTVREGVDGETLASGAGHIPGTALPGSDGNVALAAHRDTYFRPLRDVVVGDLVRLTTLDGERLYSVVSTEIVLPEDVSSLAETGDSRLTLVTCYPFSFVGSAPRRFLVRAVEIERSAVAAPEGGAERAGTS
jgi:sortase A